MCCEKLCCDFLVQSRSASTAVSITSVRDGDEISNGQLDFSFISTRLTMRIPRTSIMHCMTSGNEKQKDTFQCPENNTGIATLNFRKHNPFSQPRSKLECPPRFNGDDVCAHEKIKQQDTLSAAGLKSAVIFPPAISRRGRWHQVEGH